MKKNTILLLVFCFGLLPVVSLGQKGVVKSQGSTVNYELLSEKVTLQSVLQSVQTETGASIQQINDFGKYYNDSLVNDLNRFTVAVANNSVQTGSDVTAYSNRLKKKYVALFNVFQEIVRDYPSSVAEYVGRYHTLTFPTCNPTPCDNLGFEDGNLTGWTGCYAQNTSSTTTFSTTAFTCTGPYGAVTTSDNDPNSTGRHPTPTNQLYITSGARIDPVTGVIPVVCPSGGSYSCMIGDSTVCGSQIAILENTFTVTAATCNFTYYYAVVLQNPGHTPLQQPFFNLTMFDQSGDTIPYCGNYSVISGNGIKGFDSTTYGGAKTYYRNWTTVFVPLQHYIGQCVSIKVEVSDCEPGGHFGYAYFDCTCSPLQVITSSPSICGKSITLTAPSGGAAYIWTGPCIIGPSNTQTITAGCAGKYSVIIQSIIGASCADTLDTVIVGSISPPPIPYFKTDTVCAGNPTIFTNLTTPALGTSYVWNFGDGSGTSSAANPAHTYPSAGTYVVNLNATNGGCGGDTNLNVVVVGAPTAGFTAPTVCLNNATVFTNTSTGSAIYRWNFGEPASGPNDSSKAANPAHTYASCGTYTVTLIVGSGTCVDTDKQTVTVNPLPLPAFTATPICFGQSTIFTDGSTIGCGGTITGWSWNFGDIGAGASNTSIVQNPTLVFSSVGTYSVLFTATSNKGCQNSITQNVTIAPNPTAKFVAPPVCLGLATQFTDSSSGGPSAWKWSFGDAAGGTSTVQNPSYTYASAGTYTVKLVVSTASGCMDSTTVSVTVNPPPVANFTATTVCQGTATTFTDASTGGAVTWKWSFGDAAGGSSTLQNPIYTYASAGTYNVKLVVLTAAGCSDSITQLVVVNPNPTATLAVLPVCQGTAGVFTCTTGMVGGTYAWAFGDAAGGTSTVQNPTYMYASAGTYNATVILTSATGCTGTFTTPAIVNPIPVADFSATTVCHGTSTTFTDKSTVAAPSTIVTWAWSFGDGGTSTIQNPVHRYASCGTYNVQLTVTSNAGCLHDTIILVTVNPVPTPNFTATTVCQGYATTFTDGSTMGCGGTITTWNWTFGDGGTSTVQNPTHTYPSAGTFPVILIVTSNMGCDSAININVVVNPNPVPVFTATTPCQGSPTQFTDNSTVSSGSITNWAWSFGDGGTSNVQNPSYFYISAGIYTVRLIVTTASGCVDSIKQNVTVNPNPVVSFTASDTAGCAPLCVNFTDISTIASGSITSWSWNFGNGSTSTSQNPNNICYTKIDSKPDTFSITLTVTSNNGCSASWTHSNYIVTYPHPKAAFAAAPDCAQITAPTIYFTDQSTANGDPLTWFWNFGDGADSSSLIQNPQHTYGDTGTYYVELWVQNKYGCRDSVINPACISPVWTFFVPNAFTPNDDGINEGFIGKGIGIRTYEMWIYDRWGMQLYHCTDINKPWNGRVDNSMAPCQEDTYIWLIEITDVFFNSHKYIGKVTLIR